MYTLKNMNKLRPWAAGLVQALGLLLYVTLFVLVVLNTERIMGARMEQEVIGVISVLLAFVTSALTCGTIALGYPAYLFFSGERKKAVQIIGWNIIWLILISILALIGRVFIFSEQSILQGI